MTTITVEEIAKDVRGFLRRAGAGETLLVVEADRPLAEIKPVTPVLRQPRPLGLAAGEFVVPEDFDSPLPEGILAGFEGR